MVGAILALVSPWTIGIPQVHSVGRFGFELPICWVAVLCLFAALLIANPSLRLGIALAAEALLLGWFGWMMWLATTPQYSGVDFPFIGIDLVGPGWFEAALGVIGVGAIAARQFHDLEVRPGREVWLLAAIPGMGLMRLGHTGRGVTWAALVALAAFVASIDSPIAPLFQPIVGQFDLPPAPPTRVLDWILLAGVPALAIGSFVDTFLVLRRRATAGL
jgi:hypothetical protein